MPAPDVTAEGGAPRAGSPELAAVAGHPPHAPWLSQRPYRNSSRRVCQSGQMDPDACTERPWAPMKSLRGRTQCRDFRHHGHLAGAGPTCQPAGRGRAPDGNRDCVYWQLVFDAGAKAAQKGEAGSCPQGCGDIRTATHAGKPRADQAEERELEFAEETRDRMMATLVRPRFPRCDVTAVTRSRKR